MKFEWISIKSLVLLRSNLGLLRSKRSPALALLWMGRFRGVVSHETTPCYNLVKSLKMW